MISSSAPVTPSKPLVFTVPRWQLSSTRSSLNKKRFANSPSSSLSTPHSTLASENNYSPLSNATSVSAEKRLRYRTSLADIADNWRINARKTGIKVDHDTVFNAKTAGKLSYFSIAFDPWRRIYMRIFYFLTLVIWWHLLISVVSLQIFFPFRSFWRLQNLIPELYR